MVTIICQNCRNSFNVSDCRKDTAKYCSVDCKKKQVEKQCLTCGKEFTVKLSHANATFCCSKKCSNVAKRRKRQQEIEKEFNEPIYTLLIRMYHLEQLGIKQIAKRIGVSSRGLWEWFDELNIERRSKTEAVTLQWQHNDDRRKQTSENIKNMFSDGTINNNGENNPAKRLGSRQKISESKKGKKNWMFGRRGELHHMWNGGKVYYYGSSWPEQRDMARERDNYTCQRCGIGESALGKQLDVHHVIKFREFGLNRHAEANQLSNLICLCTSCHSVVEPKATMAKLRNGIADAPGAS